MLSAHVATSPSSPRALLLVPHERQAELVAQTGERALTRRRLVESLCAAYADLRATTPEMTRLACASAVGRSGRHAAAFDNAVGALRRAGVGTEALSRLALPRAELFARVLERVDAMLGAAGLRDERGDAWLAAKRVAEAGLEIEAESGTLLVRGLCRFDAGELALYEALHAQLVAGGGQGVVLELPKVDLGPSAAALAHVSSTLEARWANDNQHPALEQRDMVRRPKLELVRAHDDASEARAAAHAVLDALSRGVAIDRMALCVPELSEAFLEPLRQELESASIPYFEPRGRPLIAASHAHAAFELMRLAGGAINRDSLVDVIRTPGLVTKAFTSDAITSDEWALELSSLPLRIDRSHGARELLHELMVRAEDARNHESAERTRAALRATERCMRALAAERGPKPRGEFRQRWLALLGELGLTEQAPWLLARALERRAAGGRELLRAVSDNAVGMRALATAFERTTAAAAALGFADQEVELDEYLGELELAASGVGPTRGARRGAGLWLGRPEELAGLELDFVMICRATSSSVAGAAESSELFGDDLCRALPERQRPISRALAASFAELSLAWVISGARHVVVSYAVRDARGPAAPSQLAIAIAKQVEPRSEPGSPLHPSARRTTALRAPAADADRRVRVERERQLYFLDTELQSGPYNGAAGDLTAWVGASAERPLSVTALEMYARCPFLAFAGSVLRAVRDEAAGDAIGFRERGSLIHGALAAAHEAMHPLWGLRTDAELERSAMTAARTYLERRGQSALRRAGLSAALADVAAAVRWSLGEGADLPFYEAERAFGRGQEWPPLAIGPYFVSGRIDRIDRGGGGRRLRVLDYKTGKPPKRAELETQLLQPWLYGLKVAQQLGAAEVVAGYLPLGDRAPKLAQAADAGPETEEVQAALLRAERSLGRFCAGAVEPRPSQARACLRCDGRDLCRRPLSAPLATDDEQA